MACAGFTIQEMGCHVAYGDRKSERIEFERGIDVYIMGIDGTWRRDGKLNDVSRTGARLTVTGSIQGLDLKEFFLLLSSTGLAYRRCRMVRLCRRSNRRRVLEARRRKNQGKQRSRSITKSLNTDDRRIRV